MTLPTFVLMCSNQTFRFWFHPPVSLCRSRDVSSLKMLLSLWLRLLQSFKPNLRLLPLFGRFPWSLSPFVSNRVTDLRVLITLWWIRWVFCLQGWTCFSRGFLLCGNLFFVFRACPRPCVSVPWSNKVGFILTIFSDVTLSWLLETKWSHRTRPKQSDHQENCFLVTQDSKFDHHGR